MLKHSTKISICSFYKGNKLQKHIKIYTKSIAKVKECLYNFGFQYYIGSDVDEFFEGKNKWKKLDLS